MLSHSSPFAKNNEQTKRIEESESDKSPVYTKTTQLTDKIENSLLNSQNIEEILRRNQHASTSVSVTSKNITTANYLNQNNQYITSQPIPSQNIFATLIHANSPQKATLDELERKLLELEKVTQDPKSLLNTNTLLVSHEGVNLKNNSKNSVEIDGNDDKMRENLRSIRDSNTAEKNRQILFQDHLSERQDFEAENKSTKNLETQKEKTASSLTDKQYGHRNKKGQNMPAEDLLIARTVVKDNLYNNKHDSDDNAHLSENRKEINGYRKDDIDKFHQDPKLSLQSFKDSKIESAFHFDEDEKDRILAVQGPRDATSNSLNTQNTNELESELKSKKSRQPEDFFKNNDLHSTGGVEATNTRYFQDQDILKSEILNQNKGNRFDALVGNIETGEQILSEKSDNAKPTKDQISSQSAQNRFKNPQENVSDIANKETLSEHRQPHPEPQHSDLMHFRQEVSEFNPEKGKAIGSNKNNIQNSFENNLSIDQEEKIASSNNNDFEWNSRGLSDQNPGIGVNNSVKRQLNESSKKSQLNQEIPGSEIRNQQKSTLVDENLASLSKPKNDKNPVSGNSNLFDLASSGMVQNKFSEDDLIISHDKKGDLQKDWASKNMHSKGPSNENSTAISFNKKNNSGISNPKGNEETEHPVAMRQNEFSSGKKLDISNKKKLNKNQEENEDHLDELYNNVELSNELKAKNAVEGPKRNSSNKFKANQATSDEPNEQRLSKMNEEDAANFYEQRKNDLQKNMQKISKNRLGQGKKQEKKPSRISSVSPNTTNSSQALQLQKSKLDEVEQKNSTPKNVALERQQHASYLKQNKDSNQPIKKPLAKAQSEAKIIQNGSKSISNSVEKLSNTRQNNDQYKDPRATDTTNKYGDAIQFARENILQRMENIDKVLNKADSSIPRNERQDSQSAQKEKLKSRPLDLKTQDSQSRDPRKNAFSATEKIKSPITSKTEVSTATSPQDNQLWTKNAQVLNNQAKISQGISTSKAKAPEKSETRSNQQDSISLNNRNIVNSKMSNQKYSKAGEEREKMLDSLSYVNEEMSATGKLKRVSFPINLNENNKTQLKTPSKREEHAKLYSSESKNINDKNDMNMLQKGGSASKLQKNFERSRVAYSEVPSHSKYHEKKLQSQTINNEDLQNNQPSLKVQELNKKKSRNMEETEKQLSKITNTNLLNPKSENTLKQAQKTISPNLQDSKRIDLAEYLSFEERNKLWLIKKNQNLAEKERMKYSQESTYCTFQPTLNTNDNLRKLSSSEFYQKNIEWSEKVKSENTLKAQMKLEEQTKPEPSKPRIKSNPVSPMQVMKPHGLFVNKDLESIKKNLDFNDQNNTKLKKYFEYDWKDDRLKQEIDEIEELYRYVTSLIKNKSNSPTKPFSAEKSILSSNLQVQKASPYSQKQNNPAERSSLRGEKDIPRMQSLKNLTNPQITNPVSNSDRSSKESNIKGAINTNPPLEKSLDPKSTRLIIKDNRYVVIDDIISDDANNNQDF